MKKYCFFYLRHALDRFAEVMCVVQVGLKGKHIEQLCFWQVLFKIFRLIVLATILDLAAAKPWRLGWMVRAQTTIKDEAESV